MLGAEDGFFELELGHQLEVGAAHGSRTTPPAASEPAAEERVEQVAQAKIGEGIAAGSPGAPQAFGAERVVALAALGVAQHLVGARHLLEALGALGALGAGVGIGMELACELSVGALDLVVGSIRRDPEQLVQVDGHQPSLSREPSRLETTATAAMASG